MEEKKSTSGKGKKIFSTIVWGIGFLLVSVFVRNILNGSISTYIESWIALSSKGEYGDIEFIERLPERPAYIFELIGDIYHERGFYNDAINAYTQALSYEDNNIIALKIALLKTLPKQDKSSEKTITGSLKTFIDESLTRIKENTNNRDIYFSASPTYSNIIPQFQKENTELIDW